jgi:hypothetical protein
MKEVPKWCINNLDCEHCPDRAYEDEKLEYKCVPF